MTTIDGILIVRFPTTDHRFPIPDRVESALDA